MNAPSSAPARTIKRHPEYKLLQSVHQSIGGELSIPPTRFFPAQNVCNARVQQFYGAVYESQYHTMLSRTSEGPIQKPGPELPAELPGEPDSTE